eukprot:10514803-Alexandrium_andersonii.AAC.1
MSGFRAVGNWQSVPTGGGGRIRSGPVQDEQTIGLFFPATHRPFCQKAAGEPPLQGASPGGLPPPPTPPLAPSVRAASPGG